MCSASSSASREPERPPTVVLLDANALILWAKRAIPLPQEIDRLVGRAEIAVSSSVLREIDSLVGRGLVDAALARSLADRLTRIENPGSGDDAIVQLAQQRQAIVVTADRDLAERLFDAGRDVLMPRDRARLVRQAGRRPASGNG